MSLNHLPGNDCLQRLSHPSLEEKFPGIGSVIGRVGASVRSFMGNPGAWLYESGRAVLQGFINGIMSKVNAARDAVESAMKKIRTFFPNSPAKEGPFSGRGWVTYSGQTTADTFGESLASSLRAQRAKLSSSLAVLNGEFGGAPALAGVGAAPEAGEASSAVSRSVTFHVYNPVVKDGFEDDWNDANEKGLL